MSETLDAAPTEGTPDTSPADDLRAAIGAAFDEHGSGETERDDRGRFAARERETNAVADHETAPRDEQPAPEPEAPPIEAPASLSADDLSRWATLDRATQEWIAAREAKASESARTWEPVQNVLKQYEPLYAARGIAAPQALASLFEAQRMLETRPAEAIEVLARQYGVPFPRAEASTPSQPNDQISALLAEVQSLKAEIAQSKQVAEYSAAQATEQTIREFAAKPEHRHFPTVRGFMGELMRAGWASDLASAYEMACRAHPEVSKALAAEAEKAANAEKAKRADEAKRRAVSVRGAPPTIGNGQVPDSIRGNLYAAWDGVAH